MTPPSSATCRRKYGGGGDFAYAYVVAHEVGHHVQDLLGILDKADNYKQRVSQTQANAISVRVELQADCLAGVWAANANQKWQILEQGDVEKALATAQAIGDDRLQSAARGYAVPDSFTHGSSAQRANGYLPGSRAGKSIPATHSRSEQAAARRPSPVGAFVVDPAGALLGTSVRRPSRDGLWSAFNRRFLLSICAMASAG